MKYKVLEKQDFQQMKYFIDEYKEHITDKVCKTAECKALAHIKIDPEKCKGCSICAKNCPVNAIKGELKSPFEIDQDVCVKCGLCIEKCPFKAISRK